MNLSRVKALVIKDITLEKRQQQSLYGIVLYVAATVFVLFLLTGDNETDSTAWNALFWITQLFVVVNAVAKSFLGDSRGRFLYYFTIASPVDFIVSKLIMNMLLMLVLSGVSLLLFTAFLGNPVAYMGIFTGITLLGGLSLALTFTLLSAIAGKALQQASLIAILGFPVVLPQLVLLARLSKTAFAEVFQAGAVTQIALLLVGLDVLVVVLSVILFPFLWKD